jgi:hypothetical protein
MTNTICAGRGEVINPRLSEPLRSQQEVNGSKTIGITDLSLKQCGAGAQKHAHELILDAAQAHWQLDLLGRCERDTNIRGIPHKGMKGGAINGNFAMDLERLPQWQATGRGVYLQPNVGGTRAAEITACTALFLEYDDRPVEAQVGIWLDLGLPEPTLQVHTGGKSIHHYWAFNAPVDPQLWVALMDRLIAVADGCDRSCKGANRMMRMAGGWYIDSNGDAIAQSRIISATGNRYEINQFEELLPPLPTHKPYGKKPRRLHQSGTRNLHLICSALDCIPQRQAGSGTYAEYRNLLWGLIDACIEAGYSREVAIELMEDHSPSKECGWDIPQIAKSGGTQISAGTFWRQARQHGWERHHA